MLYLASIVTLRDRPTRRSRPIRLGHTAAVTSCQVCMAQWPGTGALDIKAVVSGGMQDGLSLRNDVGPLSRAEGGRGSPKKIRDLIRRLADKDERYDRAGDVLGACCALWGAGDEGAPVLDREIRRFHRYKQGSLRQARSCERKVRCPFALFSLRCELSVQERDRPLPSKLRGYWVVGRLVGIFEGMNRAWINLDVHRRMAGLNFPNICHWHHGIGVAVVQNRRAARLQFDVLWRRDMTAVEIHLCPGSLTCWKPSTTSFHRCRNPTLRHGLRVQRRLAQARTSARICASVSSA